MTLDEFKDKLRGFVGNTEDYYSARMYALRDAITQGKDNTLNEILQAECSFIATERPNEGRGDIKIVLKVDADYSTSYFAIEGMVNSWSGVELYNIVEDWREVYPKTRTMTYFD